MDTALATATGAPPLAGLHHVGITVTDLARSVAWYGEMLGMVPLMEEHHPGGRTVVLVRPGATVDVGLDEHSANEGETFACHRTGLDHLSQSVASRAELDTWHDWLTGRGVPCSEIRDVIGPVSFALFTFTDPDQVALELIYVAGPS